VSTKAAEEPNCFWTTIDIASSTVSPYAKYPEDGATTEVHET
jgi:hypothetical protein